MKRKEEVDGGRGSNHNHISHSWAFPQHLHTRISKTFKLMCRASVIKNLQPGREGNVGGGQGVGVGFGSWGTAYA